MAGDVRLTMGGEPTFVAVGDRDAAEWNTDALGPTKRGYAQALVHKLRDQYGRGGFLHFGQGKWYPGEQLPRWALNIYWRADGQPVWKNPALFTDERTPTHYTATDAGYFLRTLAGKLGLTDKYVQAGYEDTWYYLWRERRLPVNVDPFNAKLDDEMERARLRRVFNQKLDSVVGYVLPLKVGNGPYLTGPNWVTGPWFFRDERMYLMPGDSPMGLRLPLDSLPWVSEGDYPYLVQRDPNEPRGELPLHAQLAERYAGPTQAVQSQVYPAGSSAAPAASVRMQSPAVAAEDNGAATCPATSPATSPATGLATGAEPGEYGRAPGAFESAHWVTRTALCVEVRDPRRASGPKAEAVGESSGVLYVFMPPLERLEDYLDLLAAIESTATELKMQLVLEGYPPPRDARLKLLQVTPDPGVIEVNIHPVSTWKDLVANTEFLYQAAFECRLSAEKFMLDGRHTGTGGGNHFVMGGATPADSPFLRRPELLASLLLYWHNHPSLSYLFSGMFVGPTSQAPRVDEARNDQVYELEIAIAQIYKYREIFGQMSADGPPLGARAPSGGSDPHAVGERGGLPMPPWLVDRTLRNILIDVTGNTHRSEFSIDKMYSPDSATGPPGPAGAARVRDAAAPAHEQRAAVAAAGTRSALLEEPLPRTRHALGHRAARPLHAADLHPHGFRRRHF